MICREDGIDAPGACRRLAVGRGLSEPYLRDQLAAFRDGRRSNDLHRQMRNAAQGLRDHEIAELSRYYASR